MADPPWHFSGGTKGRPQHYARMRDHEIAALPVATLADPLGCWLFLWTTTPKLPAGLDVMGAWGFKFSAVGFVWVKLHRRFGRGGIPLLLPRDSFHIGTGFTTRKNTEICLLGRRGNPARSCNDIAELIIAPRREHSRKPPEAFDRVRQFAPGPYVELFSREIRPAWDSWGLERGKFNAVPL